MTGRAERVPRRPAVPVWLSDVAMRSAALERVGVLVRTEARLLWRLGAVAAAVAVTVGWTVLLRLLPADVATQLAPAVLLTDVTALGFLFVPVLLLMERSERVDVALRATPVRNAERVVARLGLVSALSVAAALTLVIALGLPAVPTRVLGVLLLATLFGLIAFALSWSANNLSDFLVRAPLVAAPLLLPALLHLAQATDWPGLYVSPVTGAVDMLRGGAVAGPAAWLAVWIVGAAWLTARSSAAVDAAGTAAHSPAHAQRRARTPWPSHPGAFRTVVALRSFARADRRTVLRDGVAVLLLVSVPLVTIALRAVATVGVPWARGRYDIALEPYLPLAEALLLTVHTSVMLGSLTGLLLLEDRDAGLLPPIAATRAGLPTLLAYRLGVGALAAAVAIGALMPFDGIAHPTGMAGIVATAIAAGAATPVAALLIATLGRNRVQGVAIMKVIGLPLYLPLAAWFVAPPARWLFAPLPTAWVTWASWSGTALGAATAALGAVAVAAVFAAPLVRRFLTRAIA